MYSTCFFAHETRRGSSPDKRKLGKDYFNRYHCHGVCFRGICQKEMQYIDFFIINYVEIRYTLEFYPVTAQLIVPLTNV